MRLSLLLLGFLAFISPGAKGQECPRGRISYIFIDNRSIFDTAGLEPDAPFRWAYRLANTLHMETRQAFLADEILFQVGECLDPLLLEETERLLREYPFIARSDVFAVPQPDGTQHVVVDTQDEWTTRLDVIFRVENRFQLTGVEASEENFLGRGILLRGFFQEDEERRDLGMELQTPRLLGTRWDARLAGGRTRNGGFLEESLFYPFVGEVGRLAARQSYLSRETLFSYSLGHDPEYSHLLLPFLDQRWDLATGWRVGEPGNLFTMGMGFSREVIEFDDLFSSIEMVRNQDYSQTVPADEGHIQEIQSQAESRKANRLSLFLGKRQLRFVQRRGLDALKGIQDVPVGIELFFGLGQAWWVKGKEGQELPHDTHAQLSFFSGRVWDRWTFNLGLRGETRYVHPFRGQEAAWRDVFGEADAYLYWQPGASGPHSVLFRLSAAGGWKVRTPFQLTLGGRESLRGFREETFPGGQRVVATVEDRVYIPWPAPELFDFGLSFFMETGQVWSGNIPFGVDSGWRASVGFGIRFGLPPGTGNMARIDLAVPLGPWVQPKDVVLRVSLREVLGILPGLRDQQLLRSLRNGVRPTVTALPW